MILFHYDGFQFRADNTYVYWRRGIFLLNPPVSRRAFLASGLAGATGAARLIAQAPQPVSPIPSARDFTRQDPIQYPDVDIIALDPRFRRYIVGNTPIRRLHFGTLWAEGPAWNGVGRFLVWSDIPNNVQMRWIEEDGRVTVFRNPSGYSNGNTFDYEGRQLSCEHGGRRVVRYEHSGTVTVVADKFQGKRLNSPNDIVVHPDGGIWFTDPPYGGQLYEGEPDVAGGPTNAAGHLNPKIGQPAGFVPGKREQPTGCYRVDPSGRIDQVVNNAPLC